MIIQKNTILYPVFFFVLLTFCSAYSMSANLVTERPTLKEITDIRETAKLAEAAKLPILMMFSMDECPYCELLKEDFLIPMIISGHYKDKILFREIHIAARAEVIDFTGQKVTISQFSRRYGVTLFPTMVFIDSTGKQLVSNIIGITTPSLFGGTLDDHIDKALAELRKVSSEE